MKKIILAILVMLCYSANAATITAITNGNWGNTATWNCGCLPAATDNVVIPPGINVLITIPGVVLSALTQITVTVNGILTINTALLGVDANDIVRINPGGSIVAAGLGGSVFSGLSNIALSPGASIIGPANITNGTLPVTLLYFHAQRSGQTVQLSWASSSEKNFDHYTIERSADGEIFAQIGNRKGAGVSSEETYYQWSDENPLPNQSYYRLRAIDHDGSAATYNVAVVDMGDPQKKCSVYPNPVTDRVIRFDVNFIPMEHDYAVLRSGDGTVVLRSNFVFGKNEIQLPGKCEPGMYILQLKTGTNAITDRVIVD